jgi:hypothetical protein
MSTTPTLNLSGTFVRKDGTPAANCIVRLIRAKAGYFTTSTGGASMPTVYDFTLNASGQMSGGPTIYASAGGDQQDGYWGTVIDPATGAQLYSLGYLYLPYNGTGNYTLPITQVNALQ